MAVRYAKQIFTSGSGETVPRQGDRFNHGVADKICYAIFTVNSTNDATDEGNIGGAKLASATTAPCIIGACGIGSPLNTNKHVSDVNGAIEIEEIAILSNGTIVNGTFSIEAYRLYLSGTDSVGWGSYRILTGTTVAVTHQTRDGGSTAERTYDVERFVTAAKGDSTDPLAKVTYTLAGGNILRGGDMLCLTNGGGTITAGAATATIIVRYRRLIPGARFKGLQTIVP